MSGDRPYETAGGLGRVRDIGHPHLFWQGRVLEPVEQRSSKRADDAKLRIVHVRIDETRQQQPASPIDDRRIWSGFANRIEGAARHDSTFVNEKTAILVCDESALVERRATNCGLT